MIDRKSFSIRLLPEIYKALKVLSALHGRSVSCLVEEGILYILDKYGKQ